MIWVVPVVLDLMMMMTMIEVEIKCSDSEIELMNLMDCSMDMWENYKDSFVDREQLQRIDLVLLSINDGIIVVVIVIDVEANFLR